MGRVCEGGDIECENISSATSLAECLRREWTARCSGADMVWIRRGVGSDVCMIRETRKHFDRRRISATGNEDRQHSVAELALWGSTTACYQMWREDRCHQMSVKRECSSCRWMEGVLASEFIMEGRCETPKRPSSPRGRRRGEVSSDPVWLRLSAFALSPLSHETSPFMRRLPSRAGPCFRRRSIRSESRADTCVRSRRNLLHEGNCWRQRCKEYHVYIE